MIQIGKTQPNTSTSGLNVITLPTAHLKIVYRSQENVRQTNMKEHYIK